MSCCNDLFQYSKRRIIEVKIGDKPMGAHLSMRIQSMTTGDTRDTIGTVEQSIQLNLP